MLFNKPDRKKSENVNGHPKNAPTCFFLIKHKLFVIFSSCLFFFESMIHNNYTWNRISLKCSPRLRLQTSIRILKFSMTFWHITGVISRIATWMLFFRSLIVCGLFAYTRLFKKPHKKNLMVLDHMALQAN